MRNLTNPAVRRLIGRELSRNKSRTAMLFSLTFLPLVFVFVATMASSEGVVGPSDWRFGQADARLMVDNGQRLDLPGDPRVVMWSEESLGGLVQFIDAPIGDPMLDGYAPNGIVWNGIEVEGRLPVADDEIVLSSTATEVLSLWRRGDSVVTSAGEFRVVGTFDDGGSQLARALAVAAPGSLELGEGYQRSGLASWPGELPDELKNGSYNTGLGGASFVRTREAWTTLQASGDVNPTVIAGLFAVGLSIATGAIAYAAWGSSIRRRLRDTGVLSASGANVGQSASVQLGQALAISVIGALTAFAAAVALVELLPFPRWFQGDNAGLPVAAYPVVSLVVPAVIAVGAAAIAGWFPAAASARAPLAALLSGRQPIERQRTGTPVLGIVLIVVGMLLLGASVVESDRPSASWPILLGGGGLIVLGIGALLLFSTLFRSIGHPRIGSSLSPTVRMVVRSASRHSARSAASVLGIGAVVAAVWGGAMDAQEYRARQPVDAVFESSSGRVSMAVAGDSADERAATVQSLLNEVDVTPSVQVVAEAFRGSEGDLGYVVPDFPAFDSDGGGVTQFDYPSILFGLQRDSNGVRDEAFDLTVLRFDGGVSQSVVDEWQSNDLVLVSGSVDPGFLDAFSARDPDLMTQMALVFIGFVVGALVIAMVTMVVGAEVRDDLRVIGLVGTSARFRQRFMATQTILLTGIGVAAGVLFGTLIRLAVSETMPFPVHVLAALVVLPFALAAGTYVTTWRPNRPPSRQDFGMAVAAP